MYISRLRLLGEISKVYRCMGSPQDKERSSGRVGKLLHNVVSCVWGEGSVGMERRGSYMDRGVFGA